MTARPSARCAMASSRSASSSSLRSRPRALWTKMPRARPIGAEDHQRRPGEPRDPGQVQERGDHPAHVGPEAAAHPTDDAAEEPARELRAIGADADERLPVARRDVHLDRARAGEAGQRQAPAHAGDAPGSTQRAPTPGPESTSRISWASRSWCSAPISPSTTRSMVRRSGAPAIAAPMPSPVALVELARGLPHQRDGRCPSRGRWPRSRGGRARPRSSPGRARAAPRAGGWPRPPPRRRSARQSALRRSRCAAHRDGRERSAVTGDGRSLPRPASDGPKPASVEQTVQVEPPSPARRYTHAGPSPSRCTR